MNDDNERKGPATKRGELMPPGPPLPLTARTGQQRTIDWLLSRISRWPFSNRAYVNSLKTAQEVIGERTKLEETIIGHGRTREKLNDLGTIIAQDKLQRQRELLEEQRRLSAVLNETMLDGEMIDARNKLKTEELKIQQMELQKRKAQLNKELEELLKKPPPAPEPPKKKTTRAQSEKQKLRAAAYKRYEEEIARIEKMKVSAKTKTELKKAAQNELEEELQRINATP